MGDKKQSSGGVLLKKMFLKIPQNSRWSLFFNKVAKTPAQACSCEFWEISNNNFIIEHFRWLLFDILVIEAVVPSYSEVVTLKIQNTLQKISVMEPFLS